MVDNYKPKDEDIKKVKKKIKTGDKARIRLTLLKKHLLPGTFKKVEKAIYFLLAYLDDIHIGFDTKVKDEGTYLHSILKSVDNFKKPLKKQDNIEECIETAFKESVGKYSIYDKDIEFCELQKFISSESGKESKVGNDKNIKKQRRKSVSGPLSGSSGSAPRSRSNSVSYAASGQTLGQEIRRRSFSMSAAEGKKNLNSNEISKKKNRHSISLGLLGSLNPKLKELVSLVESNENKLTKFYEDQMKKDTDDRYPGFTDNIMDLKQFLNNGKRGAKKLEFDKFLNKYAIRLSTNTKKIKEGIDLVNNAVKYVDKTGKLLEDLKSNKRVLYKKAEKIKGLYEIQSKSEALRTDIPNLCINYKNKCLEYLLENKKDDFKKEFDYQKLKDKFPDDLKKVYATKSDVYHEPLFKKYDNGEPSAMLAINQEYEETTDKLFDDHIKMFEQCKTKAEEFLNKMHQSAVDSFDDKWLKESPRFDQFIPDAPVKEMKNIFDDVINKLKNLKNNWKKI